jgi:hypothetical protein
MSDDNAPEAKENPSRKLSVGLNPIADSAHNYYRVGAALDASYDYGQKGDYAGQLMSMNAHPYLFDDSIQEPHDLAVSYNNRC